MACLHCETNVPGELVETTPTGHCIICGRDVTKKEIPVSKQGHIHPRDIMKAGEKIDPLLKAAEIIEKKRAWILKTYTHLDDKNIGIEVLNIVAKALRGEE